MQIIVKDSLVIAIHEAGQILDPVAAYGPGATAQSLAAGDPVPALMSAAPAPGPRTATTYQLMSALTDDQRTGYAAVKTWDQRLFSARDTSWPENNPKISRITAVLGTTPKAWFDAALA